jgi:hypothetical protein
MFEAWTWVTTLLLGTEPIGDGNTKVAILGVQLKRLTKATTPGFHIPSREIPGRY